MSAGKMPSRGLPRATQHVNDTACLAVPFGTGAVAFRRCRPLGRRGLRIAGKPGPRGARLWRFLLRRIKQSKGKAWIGRKTQPPKEATKPELLKGIKQNIPLLPSAVATQSPARTLQRS